jgi:uncharacterized caspase-like protein
LNYLNHQPYQSSATAGSVRKFIVSGLLFFLTIPFMLSANAGSDDRYALVIGNSDYQFASTLTNPKNDSADIAETLEALYFETTLLQNATKQKIETEVEKFLALLERDEGVGLFYYAGHGVQLHGDNYLVPVETQAGSDKQIQAQSFNIANLLSGMRKIKSVTNIIILDACRDNPFKTVGKAGSRSAGPTNTRGLINKNIPKLDTGLSKLDAPPNTLIAFATAPGRVAQDGDGRNSPYTTKLIESMQRSGLTIGEVFRQVRAGVVKQTDGQQIPWESSSLIQDFYFKPRASIPMGF